MSRSLIDLKLLLADLPGEDARLEWLVYADELTLVRADWAGLRVPSSILDALIPE